jgi:hypothetical protein
MFVAHLQVVAFEVTERGRERELIHADAVQHLYFMKRRQKELLWTPSYMPLTQTFGALI